MAVTAVRSRQASRERCSKQDPPAGLARRRGLDGDDHVSIGRGTAIVSRRRGASLAEQAEKELKDAGLQAEVSTTALEHGERRARDRHGSARPATSSTAGTTVTLIVSTGPKLVQVPSVVGQQQDDRRHPDPRRRARARTSRTGTPTQPAGQVIAQDPAGRQRRVKQHTTVTVVVSNGAGPAVGAERGRRVARRGDGRPEGGPAQRPGGQADDHRPERGRPGGRAGPERRHAAVAGRGRDRSSSASSSRAPHDHDHHADHAPPRRPPDAGRGPQRRALQRARGLAELGSVGRRRPARGRPRGDRGPDRARRALDSRRDGGRASRRRRACWTCDVAFPVLHGPFGEDGTVQGLLECLDVPYVGPGVLAAAMAIDKLDLQAAAGASTGSRRSSSARPARTAGASTSRPWGCPLWVKPARLGSSVGISKVTSPERALDEAVELAAAPRPAGDRRGRRRRQGGRVLGDRQRGADGPRRPGEIVAHADWYDYEAKYSEGGMDLVVPARIGERGDRAGAGARGAGVHGDRRQRDSRAATSSSATTARCSSTSSTRSPASPRPACSRSCSRRAGSPYPELCDRLVQLRARALRGASGRTGSRAQLFSVTTSLIWTL